MIKLVRGFRDILPEDVGLWQHVEKTARELLENFGFSEIRLPVLEHTELFARGIGADTDIVEKEMYTFTDRGGDLLTLRPEATAGVARAYIEHGFPANRPVQKLWTMGPMFRRERPQRGRFRQFYQVNAEILGVADPLADAQALFLLLTFLSRLGVTDATAHVNSLGCPKCRPAYKETLSAFIRGRAGDLCENCLRRSEANPLRVLDCKSEHCSRAVEGAPAITDHLCNECREHFDRVIGALRDLGKEVLLDSRLVRGLDYYTRTTFEIRTSALGAQNAIAGGGRYDGLVELLGGPPTPGLGFAVGEDRLIEILAAKGVEHGARPAVYLAWLGEKARDMAFRWQNEWAQSGLRAEMDLEGRSLKAHMKRAGKGYRWAVVLGDEEMARGKVQVRDMETSGQNEVPFSELLEWLARATR